MSRSAIISIIAAILLVIFAVQNAGSTKLTILFWNFEMSLALMLLILFITGAGFGYFFHIAVGLRRKKSAESKDTTSKHPETHI